MTVRSIVLGAALALVALHAVPARADRATSASAEEHFRLGVAFFQIGEYDRALAEYQLSFDLSANPLLIFNIALCHDRANQPELALQAFRRYLALAPNGAVADEAREDVARLTLVVDKIAADHAAVRAAEDARRHQRDDAVRRDAETRAASDERRRRITRTIVVSGAVVALAGATAHVLAWRTRDRLAGAPDPDTYFDDRETFRLERNLAIGAYTAGALAIATGLILGRTVISSDGPQLAATIAPGSAALAVRWLR